jgi:hypothetical protein
MLLLIAIVFQIHMIGDALGVLTHGFFSDDQGDSAAGHFSPDLPVHDGYAQNNLEKCFPPRQISMPSGG